eukprot:Pgem_evm1s19901
MSKIVNTSSSSNVNWNRPALRSGPAYILDFFFGPGATTFELIYQFTLPFLLGFAQIHYGNYLGLNWSLGQKCTAFYIALDMFGGAFTNATSSAK